MKIQNRRVITQFIAENADSAAGLERFVKIVSAAHWNHPGDVKQTFASADLIGNNKWIFNISGNNYRLLAMVWMHNGIVHILKVMTHADYDKETFS